VVETTTISPPSKEPATGAKGPNAGAVAGNPFLSSGFYRTSTVLLSCLARRHTPGRVQPALMNCPGRFWLKKRRRGRVRGPGPELRSYTPTLSHLAARHGKCYGAGPRRCVVFRAGTPEGFKPVRTADQGDPNHAHLLKHWLCHWLSLARPPMGTLFADSGAAASRFQRDHHPNPGRQSTTSGVSASQAEGRFIAIVPAGVCGWGINAGSHSEEFLAPLMT